MMVGPQGRRNRVVGESRWPCFSLDNWFFYYSFLIIPHVSTRFAGTSLRYAPLRSFG
jgi:hypothetical protein